MDSETAKHHHGNRIGHVAGRLRVQHGPCRQGVITRHGIALAQDEATRRALLRVPARTLSEPDFQLGFGAAESFEAVSVVKGLRSA